MAICDSDEEDREALLEILKVFPALLHVEHELTSRPSRFYNCIAFALGDEDHNCWPIPPANSLSQYYWPRRIPHELSVTAFQLMFKSRDYVLCANADFEVGMEKIALYCDAAGKPTHAARQITSESHRGQWKSKIGILADIRHATLAALEGAEYGRFHSCFARKINA